MGYLLYNALLILGSPIILAILLAKPRCRRGLAQRLGLRPPSLSGTVESPLVWVHAVSLGEVIAAAPLIRAMARRFPACRFVVTTITETGREAVEQRLHGVAAHVYAPLDLPWVVTRLFDALRPAAVLIVETELWPNLLRVAGRRRVPTLLVNGRLSSKSFARYRLIEPFMRHVLGFLTMALMQSDRDRERLIALGAPAPRVARVGNLKFDQPLPEPSSGAIARDTLLPPEAPLLVAGSTHPGEEDILLEAYRALLPRHPSLVLLLAPRHIERADDVVARVAAHGLHAVRRSALASSTVHTQTAEPRVIVLDTRGELAALYRYGAVAFVGGTLVPVGGHNLLEPAQWGKPVFFGPYTDHCAEVASLLLASGGGRQVADTGELVRGVEACLDHAEACAAMGRAARAVVEENRGAIDRTVAVLEKILSP